MEQREILVMTTKTSEVFYVLLFDFVLFPQQLQKDYVRDEQRDSDFLKTGKMTVKSSSMWKRLYHQKNSNQGQSILSIV